MRKNVEVKKVSESAIKKVVMNEELSKSKKMISLFELGLEVKEIAVIMNVRYNFVYNVVSNYSIVNSIETVTNKKEGKKDKIVTMFKEGKSTKEIAIELKANMNYVYNVIKEIKQQNNSNVE